MPKHELFHSPEEFPFFALGHTPYGFIYLYILREFSSVQALCAPDSPEEYWPIMLIFISVSPGLKHFKQG